MTRRGFYFDSERCVGCKTCMVACKKKNNLPAGAFFRRVTSYEVGEFPVATMYHWSRTCNHCANPACVRACPTAAMYRDEEDGTVQHNDDTCIGCGSCAIACPYDVPILLKETGMAAKCNGCIDTRPEDGVPTCVAACGMRALDFGTFEELAERHPEASNQLACMPDAGITDPTVFIDARECAFDPSYRELVL